MHGIVATVTLPNPLSVLPPSPGGGWPWGRQGWFGDRNLSALGTCVSLLPAHLQPSGAGGPTEALRDSSQRQQAEERLRTAVARPPPWLAGPYQTPATAHPAPCQPLWRAAPGLICRAGEEDGYQVVGSYTFLVSKGCIGCVSPDNCLWREGSPSAHVRGPGWKCSGLHS